MQHELTYHNFKNIGFIQTKLTNEQLKPVRDEIQQIQSNFDNVNNKKANNTLAGNIKREYFLVDSLNHLQNTLVPFLRAYEDLFKYASTIDIMPHSYPLVLDEPWVNFQKKGEFNPNHDHSGIISYVIYINVPYTIEDEMNNESGKNSNRNIPAHFEFTYTDCLGRICNYSLPVDRTYENTLLMFPSRMIHCVYPFYTSDEYRISVSGNFVLKID